MALLTLRRDAPRRHGARVAGIAALCLFATQGALAQTARPGAPTPAQLKELEQFYAGKQMSMIIGYPPGGSNDLYARSVARHIGKHIPGNPSVIPRTMPGGGSLVAANHVANVAPKDGTTLALVAGTIPLEAALGQSGVKFDVGKLNWIGRISSSTNAVFMWHTSPVKTFEDAKARESVLAATGRSSTVSIFPSVMNAVLGSKFKIVLGYKGSAESMLAVERGEVEGHATNFDGMKAAHPDWLTEKKINIPVQVSRRRHREMPDVPTMIELGRNDAERQILTVVTSGSDVGKPVFSAPGEPPERTAALRRAFDEMTTNDKEFAAELAQLGLELDPMPGVELQALIQALSNTPTDVLTKVKEIYPLN